MGVTVRPKRRGWLRLKREGIGRVNGGYDVLQEMVVGHGGGRRTAEWYRGDDRADITRDGRR